MEHPSGREGNAVAGVYSHSRTAKSSTRKYMKCREHRIPAHPFSRRTHCRRLLPGEVSNDGSDSDRYVPFAARESGHLRVSRELQTTFPFRPVAI